MKKYTKVDVSERELEGLIVRNAGLIEEGLAYVNHQQPAAGETKGRLQRNLNDLMAKKDRVVDAFLHRGVIDQRTYERQADKLDEEIAIAETALHDARLDELDVEGMLGFAEYVLTNPGRLWVEASL